MLWRPDVCGREGDRAGRTIGRLHPARRFEGRQRLTRQIQNRLRH